MSEPVKVYDASNGPEAELIREELAEHDIEAFINHTPSPLDGLTAMGQGTPVFVRSEDADRAARIINEMSFSHLDAIGDDGDWDDDEDAAFDDDQVGDVDENAEESDRP